MNNGVKLGALILVLIVLSVGFSAASFSYKNNNLRTSYSAGEKIGGALNISFTSEPASSLLRSNFNGSMKIIDLLKANQLVEGRDYTCTYPRCFDSYQSTGELSGTTNLSGSTPLIVGFKLTGEQVKITSVKFSIASTANKSCSRQLLIDVPGRNDTFIQNSKSSGVLCGNEYRGCFDRGTSNFLWATIPSNKPYCEKITLTPAPAYRIGGVIKNGTVQSNIKMALRDSEGEPLGDECILPIQSSDIQQIGCDVNYSISSGGDYFVCIYAEESTADYKIKTEDLAPMCGISDDAEYNIDFDLFASPLEFAAVGTFDMNDTLLATHVDDYLENVYQRNCSLGCIIPFKITGITQDLTFSNAEVQFTRAPSINTKLNDYRMYKFNSDIAKITTPKSVNLEVSFAGLTIPLGSNATKLYLYLNSQAILPSPLNISIAPSFGFDISPKTVLIGAKTKFQAITSANITSSSWNFGDGTTKTAYGKSVSHRYVASGSGNYSVEVELTRSDGVKARNFFEVGIGSLRLSAGSLVSEYESRLVNLSVQINALPIAIVNALKTKINITEMQASLAAVKRVLGNASSDADYLAVINSALAINPPASVVIAEEGKSIPLSFGIENANTNYIEQISEINLGSESARSDLKGAISSWLETNYGTSTDYAIITGVNDDDVKTPILTYFKVSMTKKSGAPSTDPAYFVIDYPMGSISFLGNYSPKTVGSGTYIQLDDSKTVEFILSGAIGISSLGMYLSPQISQLMSTEGVPFAETGGFRWGRFILWMIVLLIIAFAVYIALQEWYKRRYESYLFKNPADLYNAITFVHNSRKNGLDDSEIAKKLKNAGWTGERVTYAFNKLDGKRTGMFEIPIFRFFEQRRIMKEIEKRRAEQQLSQVNPAAKTMQPQQTKPLLK